MKTKLFLTLFLIFVAITATFTFLVNGSNIIGVNFYESDEVAGARNDFMEELVHYQLNPIDFEKAKAAIRVEEMEIHYYRDYYGTLDQQVENIRLQYEDILANESLSAEDRKIYENQRETKLAEIRKNFESDSVVEQKIRALKEKALEKYEQSYVKGQKNFKEQLKYFGYTLVDDKGESYEALRESDVVNRTLFKNDTEWYVSGSTEIDLFRYLNGEPGVDGHSVIYLENPELVYTGEVVVYKSIINKQGLTHDQGTFEIRRTIFYLLWAAGLVAIILLATVVRPNRELFSWPAAEELLEKSSLDVRIVVPLFSGIVFLTLLESIPYKLYWLVEKMIQDAQSIIVVEDLFSIVLCFIFMSVLILTGSWLISALKNEELKSENSLFVRVGLAIKESFLNKSIGKQTLAMFIVFFLGGIGFAGALVAPPLLLIYIPLFMFILLPVTFVYFKRMGYLNKVMQQTEAMAAGELATAVEVKGKSPIAKHAANLNDVRKGIEISMKEQAKSERLKTELITNVSHDLRTPLTSIITYTDLLKNPELSAEERVKYVDILDKKSARLKTLIEDLFEVSKMASGNIDIMKQQVDLAQMLQQAVAEHEEDFANAGLDLRITIHDQPILAQVDGQKWWRVVDNLLINARKYSLAGTRVYVTLKESKGVAEFAVKNIAKYELGDNIEELTERFKRADTSRHTEGSGLGLAIAQSIVDLHGGQMTLEVDGDLFKVTVKVNTI